MSAIDTLNALRRGETVTMSDGTQIVAVTNKERGENLEKGDLYWAGRRSQGKLFIAEDVDLENRWIVPNQENGFGYAFDLHECVGVKVISD